MPMSSVADTNTVVSGLLWKGAPKHVLDAAREGKVELCTSATLLAELQDVLGRSKFTQRLEQAGVKADELVLGYAALAKVIQPGPIDPVILADPDDDAVLACAVAAQAEAIISGDSHLLSLGEYQGIPILTAAEFLKRLRGDTSSDSTPAAPPPEREP
jgi:uncharacterized protein